MNCIKGRLIHGLALQVPNARSTPFSNNSEYLENILGDRVTVETSRGLFRIRFLRLRNWTLDLPFRLQVRFHSATG